MPELPEIETIVSDLKDSVLGKSIADFASYTTKLRKPVDHEAGVMLVGASILDVERMAKYIVVTLDNMYYILMHLGMTGSVLIVGREYALRKHDHVLITLDGGLALVFNDPRRFGLFLVGVIDDIRRVTKHLGKEPLELDAAYLRDILRGRRCIKDALTDQKLVVGIGNIYASEILFQSRINPRKAAHSLTDNEVFNLYRSIRLILNKAITLRGATIKDFKDLSGESGGYQREFMVYDCAGKSCRVCDGVINKITQNGRATYLCENCQV